jgi:hypothetical protein
MNLDGKSVPNPHPAWGVCADELLFYTSRYAGYTGRRLLELGAGRDFDMRGFQASHMSPVQRNCMARLLALAPNPSVVRAMATLAATVATGEPQVPKAVRKVAGKCRARPHLQIAPSRPRHSAGLAGAAPCDVLRHLGRRYGFRVVIAGRHVWLNEPRLARLLQRTGSRQARNVQEVLGALQRREYRLHLPNDPGRSIGCGSAY